MKPISWKAKGFGGNSAFDNTVFGGVSTCLLVGNDWWWGNCLDTFSQVGRREIV